MDNFMKWFASIEDRFTKNTCDKLFLKESTHLWNIWNKSHHSFITFYSNIGKVHRLKILEWSKQYMDPSVSKYFV